MYSNPSESERYRLQIKERLPYMIEEYGLFKGNEAKGFSVTKGGVFRCPVCGRKIGLYRKKGGTSNPWGINGFAHCSCFGKGGYSADTFGLYAAITGISEEEAFKRLMAEESGENTAQREKRAELYRKKRAEADREESERVREMKEAFSKALYGYAIPDKGRKLLKMRGIMLRDLPKAIRDNVGYLPPSELTSRNGKNYKAEGIMFRLSEDSAQLRRTRGLTYITRKTSRFLTAGKALPFMSSSIREGSGPLFITEGPFDALSAAALGFERVTATIGAGNHSYIVNEMKEKGLKGIVYIAFDEDTAGKMGSESLLSSLSVIEGLTVLRSSVNGGCGDLNGFLIKDRKGARDRIRILKGIAECLENGLIDRLTAEEMLRTIHESDQVSHDEAIKRQAPILKTLVEIWRGKEAVCG